MGEGGEVCVGSVEEDAADGDLCGTIKIRAWVSG